jgi:hypothetical protein
LNLTLYKLVFENIPIAQLNVNECLDVGSWQTPLAAVPKRREEVPSFLTVKGGIFFPFFV